ncbi:FAD-dependent monooxygenase [Streptomyces sp. LP05-1]|uniref:FAD-dependent monooxygenase n=1 Tax=Streptomyces pyxinae TaxID=2970734 RepID=A0ABT2CQR0_9ACTN|nr:FAD-dependent monooxygenase [Streptomyces sp. LP05-1]MCS0639606.1 FAD-dependent monooxygenase [Streptomyces sp. LP05-1]
MERPQTEQTEQTEQTGRAERTEQAARREGAAPDDGRATVVTGSGRARPPEEFTADICVVGAGPAGLVLALLLLKSGLRVAVVERARAHQREFRGEILQPGALTLLDSLGVLAGARARGAHEHTRFRLVEGGRTLLDIDYRELPAPYDYLLSIPQAHVLDELLLHCDAYEGFTYLDGRRVGELLREDGRITGVAADGPGGACTVRAHVVVGADGRFSKVRRLAGIEAGRREAFDLDVLWFKLTDDRSGARGPETLRDVRVFRAGGSPVLVYDSWPDRVQVGWTLPHKGFKDVAAQGIDRVKEQLAQAVPPYAELIREQIGSMRDLSLLDVFSGRAERWSDDGLVLIGDAAHTHSPIGAQGINLAIQDAVLLHPLLVASHRAGDASAEFLSAFERTRSADIEQVMRLQRLQSKAMLSRGTFATRVRPRLAALLRRTPVYRRVLGRIALGNPSVRIAEELFVPDVPEGGNR